MRAAKQAATLDVLSGGRLTLGIGIGWSAEEFTALGVEFSRRGPRTAEYVAAMRTLWADDVASFSGRGADRRQPRGAARTGPGRDYRSRGG